MAACRGIYRWFFALQRVSFTETCQFPLCPSWDTSLWDIGIRFPPGVYSEMIFLHIIIFFKLECISQVHSCRLSIFCSLPTTYDTMRIDINYLVLWTLVFLIMFKNIVNWMYFLCLREKKSIIICTVLENGKIFHFGLVQNILVWNEDCDTNF